MADIPADSTTDATVVGVVTFGSISVGAFSGEMETRGDHDWVRFDVVAGSTYQIAGDMVFGSYNQSPAMTIRQANGNPVPITRDPDTGMITMTAQQTGPLYIDVSAPTNSFFIGGSTYDLVVTRARSTVEVVPSGSGTFHGAAQSLVLGSNSDDAIILGSFGLGFGRNGDDDIYTDAAGGSAHGGNGDDALIGADGVDSLWGGHDDDVLQGRGGADFLYGDQGRDVLFGGDGNDRAYGGALEDIIQGDAGNDTIDGGSGADNMSGGEGDDLFYVDDADDLVIESEGGGFDSVLTTIGFKLSSSAEIESLGVLNENAKTALNLVGNDYSQTITGNDGKNSLTGAGGDDTLVGNGGADTLSGGSGFDSASYAGAASRVVVNLAAPGGNTGDAAGDVYISIENVIGSDFNDVITGDSRANLLAGGAGNDSLNGGAGTDRLDGGAGKDTFIFDTALAASNVDVILGFQSVDDTIQLAGSIFRGIGDGRLAASAFKDLATGAVDANDRIIFDSATGDLFWDRDGSGSEYARVKFATLDLAAAVTLTNQDFFIV